MFEAWIPHQFLQLLNGRDKTVNKNEMDIFVFSVFLTCGHTPEISKYIRKKNMNLSRRLFLEGAGALAAAPALAPFAAQAAASTAEMGKLWSRVYFGLEGFCRDLEAKRSYDPTYEQNQLLQRHTNWVFTLKNYTRFLELGGKPTGAFCRSMSDSLAGLNADVPEYDKERVNKRRNLLARMREKFKELHKPGVLARAIHDSETATLAALNAVAEEAQSTYRTAPFGLDHLILRCTDSAGPEKNRGLNYPQWPAKNVPCHFMLLAAPDKVPGYPCAASFYTLQDVRLVMAIYGFMGSGLRFYDEGLDADNAAIMDRLGQSALGRYLAAHNSSRKQHLFCEGSKPAAFKTMPEGEPPALITTDQAEIFIPPEKRRYIFPSGAAHLPQLLFLPESGSTGELIKALWGPESLFAREGPLYNSLEALVLDPQYRFCMHLSPRQHLFEPPGRSAVTAAARFLAKLAAETFMQEKSLANPIQPRVSSVTGTPAPALPSPIEMPLKPDFAAALASSAAPLPVAVPA